MMQSQGRGAYHDVIVGDRPRLVDTRERCQKLIMSSLQHFLKLFYFGAKQFPKHDRHASNSDEVI